MKKVFRLLLVGLGLMIVWSPISIAGNWNKQEKQTITFIHGLDFSKMNLSEPSLLIIDDLILETNKETVHLFLVQSHHYKISVFFLTQNLFFKNKKYQLMSLNTHYFVIFHSQRNTRQVYICAMQYYIGRETSRVINCYKYAGTQPFGFIVLSFAPELPNYLQVCTNFFEPCPLYFL